jgi:hypothetical protein
MRTMVIGIALTGLLVGGIAVWWLITEIRQADRRQQEALTAEVAGLRVEVQRLQAENTAQGAEVQRLHALTERLRVDKQAFETEKQAYLVRAAKLIDGLAAKTKRLQNIIHTQCAHYAAYCTATPPEEGTEQ